MLDIKFEGFFGRDEELEKIIRYNMEKRSPMYYRTNLLLHSRRTTLLIDDIKDITIGTYNGDFNPNKALTLALVHDDAEIITGDVQLYYKDRMSEEELLNVEKREEAAIERLGNTFPRLINGFSYKELLYHALKKNCLEAQVVSYCDKIDAFCESLHEVFAGNMKFVGPVRDYIRRLNKFPDKFPLIGKIFPNTHPLLQNIAEIDVIKIAENGEFHTSEKIKQNSGIPHYDRWKEITREYFGEDVLLDVKEK